MPSTFRAANRSPVLALVLALGLGVVLACQPSTAATEQEASAGGARRREIPRVRVTAVERREMVQELETTSVLESELEIEVFPRTSGVVTEVLAEEGEAVAAGQLLARLDDRDARLAVSDSEVALEEAQNAAEQSDLAVQETDNRVRSALAAAEQAERDYARDLALFEGTETESALSRKALEASLLARDNARFDYEQARILWNRSKLEAQAAQTAVSRARVKLERDRLALDYRQILAPFEGVVAERNVRLGDSVSTAAMVYVLTDIEALRAVFQRPQEELTLFTSGAGQDDRPRLTFTARAEAYPDELFHGYIVRISPTIHADSGQFRVTARIESGGGANVPLLPGMLVRMRIVTDRHPDALVVPKRALRREGELRYVLLVEEVEEESEDGSTPQRVSRVRRVAIEEGFAGEDDIEIFPAEGEQLEAGDLVVTVGSRDLADEDPVRIDDGLEEDPMALIEEQPAEPEETGEEDVQESASSEEAGSQ